MALVVNTNMKTLEELQSDPGINSTEDEPEGYEMANSFETSIALIRGASQNANQVQPVLQRADGTYSYIFGILVQMKPLVIETVSGQSTIEDVDMAFEVSNLTKNHILQHSAMAMQAQANAQALQILKLHQ